MRVRIVVGAATDVGRVRDHNEDGYLVDDTLALVAVADGMGGHRGGEVASAVALDALRTAFAASRGIHDAMAVANRAVCERAATDAGLRGMGTTLTAGALDDQATLVIGHVGDSRAYLVRDGELTRLTTDHSVVEELMAVGELTEEEAGSDPRRSMITRALGLEPVVDVDLYPVELRPLDRVLLCSDGLTAMLRGPAIAAVLADEPDADAAARRLVDAANAAGGVDNTTALVIDVLDDDGSADRVTRAGIPSTSDPSRRRRFRLGSRRRADGASGQR